MVSEATVPGQERRRSKKPLKGRTRPRRKQAQAHAGPQAKLRKSAQAAHATTVTAPSQPDLLLAAIRTAPQPLTIEDLRQLPSVDGSRLQHNMARLVEQRKIQETPAGYVVVST
jgi:hypothetical protein